MFQRLSISRFLLMSIFVVLISPPTKANDPIQHHVSYKMFPFMDPQDGHCMNVEATFQGYPSGEYLILHPIPGMKNITFPPSSYRHHQFSMIPAAYRLLHTPDQPFKFDYQFCRQNDARDVSYPIIDQDYFMFLVKDVLVAPYGDPHDKISVEMDIELPEGSTVATSFNIREKHYQVETTLKDFLISYMVGGKISIEAISINNKPVYVVTNGEWSYFHNKLPFYIETIVRSQRDFWQDHEFPFFLISLTKQYDLAQKRMMAGAYSRNTASILLQNKEEHFLQTLKYISNLTFHAWLGYKMFVNFSEKDILWFTDGFNDFYSTLTLLNNRIFSIKDYLDVHNFLIKLYYTSPINQHLTNETLVKNFAREEMKDAVRLRGYLLASHLRWQAEQLPHNENALDVAMKALYQQYQQKNLNFLTFKEIDQVFEQHLGKELWQETKSKIISGDPIEFPTTFLGKRIKLQWKWVESPRFGFNVQKLFDNNIIAEVEPDSSAYLAGLRNGQKVLSHNISFYTDQKHLVSLKIAELNQEKNIEFFPMIVKKRIPQYENMPIDSGDQGSINDEA